MRPLFNSVMSYVLDTSAIISRRFNLAGPDVLIPDSVIEEIRKGKLKSMLDAMDETIKVMSPSRESIKAVREKARISGDLDELSDTDIDVIALAYETKSKIISDDFAIQNVASLLSIDFMGADISEIRQQVIWNYRCTGCRKFFTTPIGLCPVCGHEVVRSRAVSRKKKK